MTLVVDASALVDAAIGFGAPHWDHLVGAAERSRIPLVAPELMWSEAYSALHERLWRRLLDDEDARDARTLIAEAPIQPRRPAALRDRAWEIADRMGWAKTYDAEYCALAELLGCDLITGDRRLRAAATRLGYVWTVAEGAERLAAAG